LTSAPSRGKARKGGGCLGSGCGLVLLVAILIGGWALWRITLPRRLAAATHAKLRPGTTLPEVFKAADEYWSATGTLCSGGIESFQVFTPARLPRGAIRVSRPHAEGRNDSEDLPFHSKDELVKLLESRAELRTCRRVGFTFVVSGVPPRTSFTVELDGEGRVLKVGDPRTWD
jgi:hypothetical protein